MFQGNGDNEVGNGGTDVQRIFNALVNGTQLQDFQGLVLAGKQLLGGRIQQIVAGAFYVLSRDRKSVV